MTMVLTCALLLVGSGQAQPSRRRAVRLPPPVPPAVMHYRSDAGRSGTYITAGPRTLHGTRWQSQLAGDTFSAPVAANGAVYVAGPGGRVQSFDASTGALRWSSAVVGEIVSAPTVSADSVYVGVDRDAVVALAVSNGRQTATFNTGSWVVASPLIAADTLYAGCESGQLIAFDLATGREKWRFDAGRPLHGHPALSAGTIVVGGADTLLAVDTAGREKWRLALSGAGWSPSPAIAGGVIFDSFGDALYAVDLATGSIRWSQSAGGDGSIGWTGPAVWNGLVIAGTTDARIRAFFTTSGASLWTTTLPDSSEIIVADGTVYGGTVNFAQTQTNPNAPQKAFAVDAGNGRLLWTFDVSGQVATGCAVGDGRLFLFTESRALYAIE